ncbi:NAD(P)-dependent dehydrogenase, short-chain alcohol dehydrogenase family [Paenibacillus sp. 1_12]|uniref:SDR family oxidoreductase n=1 Tax=Paenibacillus sp. 1_12 TaxID=1566278 RepID=UPI0008EC9556|nr:SDR family oxidoreductase [Paenibacillus sp. 1_12]SFK81419.1 NAD(P)-dependent dehydrogenase, short-chain alcohol dehydrogenase family [Paenibacillus sp. 1_12]
MNEYNPHRHAEGTQEDRHPQPHEGTNPPKHTNYFNLSGRTAIVTGGLGLLGQRFCKALADCGAQVAVVDLDQAKVEDFAHELADSYDTYCIGVACDVSDPESVARMVDAVVGQQHHIDILLNNAATKTDNMGEFFAPFETYSLTQWRKVMSVNLDGMFLVAQAVGKWMIEQNTGGSVIQTSSIYGELGPDERIYEGSQYLGMPINTPAVYSASKAGVIGLSKYLATRWAPYGIRVNTLTPGGMESGQNDCFIQKYANRVPLGRMGRPDELTGAVLYLASDASSYVTGHNLIVDGGLHAW